MSISEELRENLTAQICELEVLQSVYPKELSIGDHGILADINGFIVGTNNEIPQRLEYSVEMSAPNGVVELQVNLPSNYPKAKPELYARGSLLDRNQQTNLNKALSTFLEIQEKGEPCIYALILWLRDNLEKYCEKKRETTRNLKESKAENDTTFARYWIYSHHIYSKFKRRDISDVARENSISGFCLAGKPGIICAEGALTDCEYWWQKIKAMNWHKILVKLIEEESLNGNGVDSQRKFSGFQEISFPSTDRHNDMGQFLKYLTNRSLQHVFKELFGIEGQSTQLPSY